MGGKRTPLSKELAARVALDENLEQFQGASFYILGS